MAIQCRRQQLAFVCVVLLASVLAGCASSDACYTPETPPGALRSVYVVKRAWHTGVAIAAADWPNREWSVLADFPQSRYLEFGWGDALFYQAEEESSWLALRAALLPTSSAVHVIGFQDPTPEALRADEVVEVRLSAEGLRQLAHSIEREFSQRAPEPIGTSMEATPQPNKFYTGQRSFFFPRMCNWWTAKRLEEAGCPVAAWSVIMANRMMREARGFAGTPHRSSSTNAM